MRITDLLKKEGIRIGTAPADKSEAIEMLIALHENCGSLTDAAAYREGILAREAMGTTAIGMEIAIPHAKSAAVKAPALTAMTVPGGVDYGSPDGMPAKLLFMIAATPDGDVHMEVLARMMQLLMDFDLTDALKAAKTPEEFLALIDAAEAKKFPDEVKAAPAPEKPAPPASLTPIWRPKRLPRPAKSWAFPSRSKPTAPAAQRTCSRPRISPTATAL